ncbi:hypothetical protein [Arthrobacter sp. VKM Ac-2550]|uniref:hypothetical protein n=1 Tax=Crystallibacter permensis TaxID=1938888 RepID=UPI0022273182|nr:hypothetical protein [Arthrobacter sp. VKM Ac-2550]MCW2133364.1 hypothetical protein [Arthrobacter sp. VKM Ac-2550]
MGSDYRRPVADVYYCQDSRADSIAEEQLEAFTLHGSGIPGPVDAVWVDRQDLP